MNANFTQRELEIIIAALLIANEATPFDVLSYESSEGGCTFYKPAPEELGELIDKACHRRLEMRR
jgi:hypothetical protein